MRQYDLRRLQMDSRIRKSSAEVLEGMKAQALLAPSIRTVWLTAHQYGQLVDEVNRQTKSTGKWKLHYGPAVIKHLREV